MARTSIIRGDHIEYGFWLVFDASGDVRMTRNEPAMSPGERGMRLTAVLPKAIFRTPSLTARIEVPNPGVDDAGRITAIVQQAAEHSLKEIFGVDVVLSVKPAE